jgi:parallel beta-helix repeat protein
MQFLHSLSFVSIVLLVTAGLLTGCSDAPTANDPPDEDVFLETLDLAPEDIEGGDTDALRSTFDTDAVVEAVRASERGEPSASGPTTVVRPGESIQDAIDDAPARGTVFIRPGTYVIEETLTINKPLHLVGLGGPGAVVIQEADGADIRNGIFAIDVQGLSLINLTVRGFTGNGVLLVEVNGFLLFRLITDQSRSDDADPHGAYGLFPVRSQNGLIAHCTATRADDSGIYVGQSENVAVVHNEAFGNVIGLEAENVKQTVWAHNRAYDNAAGMLAILLPIDEEDEYPIVETHAEQLYVAHNRFTDNNGENFAPGGLASVVPEGTGLLVFGYDDSDITRNRVTDNDFVGIGLASSVTLLLAAGRDLDLLATIPQGPHPDDVRITDNRVMDNGAGGPVTLPGFPEGTPPIPAVDLLWDQPILAVLLPEVGYGTGNCWADNTFATSFPGALPSCDASS